MRQPCMGSIDWIDKEKKLKIKEAKTEKKEEVKKLMLENISGEFNERLEE